MAWKFGMKFLGVTFWSRDFWGFVWSPRDFLGFWFLPPFDHPCLLKSREAPLGHTIVKHWQGHGLFLKTWNKIQNSDEEHTYPPSHPLTRGPVLCQKDESWNYLGVENLHTLGRGVLSTGLLWISSQNSYMWNFKPATRWKWKSLLITNLTLWSLDIVFVQV